MALHRTWQHVAVQAYEDGYAIRLDDTLLKTPAGAALVLPTTTLAEKIAQEWKEIPARNFPAAHPKENSSEKKAGQEKISPPHIPLTQLAMTVQDLILPRRDQVIQHLVGWLETDVLNHPIIPYAEIGGSTAGTPNQLAQRQKEKWWPEVAWFNMHIQPQCQKLLQELSPHQLGFVQQMTEVSGSLILAMGCLYGRYTDAAQIQNLSELEILFQAETWGMDEETRARLDHQAVEIAQQLQFLANISGPSRPDG